MQMAAHEEIKAQEALELLKGWFNNKMMVVMFRIQHTHIYKRKEKRDVREQLIFLNDIQHHFGRKGPDHRDYYNATKWLKAFFRTFPEGTTPERAEKAWTMLKPVYQGFGLKFPFNGDGTKKDPTPFKKNLAANKAGERSHELEKDKI